MFLYNKFWLLDLVGEDQNSIDILGANLKNNLTFQKVPPEMNLRWIAMYWKILKRDFFCSTKNVCNIKLHLEMFQDLVSQCMLYSLKRWPTFLAKKSEEVLAVLCALLNTQYASKIFGFKLSIYSIFGFYSIHIKNLATLLND